MNVCPEPVEGPFLRRAGEMRRAVRWLASRFRFDVGFSRDALRHVTNGIGHECLSRACRRALPTKSGRNAARGSMACLAFPLCCWLQPRCSARSFVGAPSGAMLFCFLWRGASAETLIVIRRNSLAPEGAPTVCIATSICHGPFREAPANRAAGTDGCPRLALPHIFCRSPFRGVAVLFPPARRFSRDLRD
jgi:hypothetical protein